ncbi:GntR family transcriptional regulator [Microbacterium sp.]|uniref:GntR family transcriptional regulator n=1 Tax=Microbacterium sp. TaxID=51671 RepID=UPI0039E4A410
MTDSDISLDERLSPVSADGAALSSQIFDIVGHAIVDGTLEPGERVNDKELAAALGISRTPVREALQRLTWVGLVEVAPSRYTRVTDITDDQVLSTLEHMGMQAGVALHLAMRRMDAAQLVEAVSLLDRLIAASDGDDQEGLVVESLAFVEYLVARTRNPIFRAMMHETSLLVARNLKHAQSDGSAMSNRSDLLRATRDAMMLGDADAAEKAFRGLYDVGLAVAA